MKYAWPLAILAAVTLPGLLFSQGDSKPAASHVVALNGHEFTLPLGFEIELAAGPPLVDRPITAAFDDQGRLYVTDSSGSNDKVDKQLAERPHRVVRLEDSDGDGVYDKSIVYADRLMFPEGSMWLDGSLYVSAPPSIWKLTDTDGDGVADQRQEWFSGKTLTGCANDLHGPYLGPDGWIYWCKGAFAKQTYERTGGSLRVIPELPLNIVGKEQPDGAAPAAARRDPPAATWSTRASHIFRCRPDGSGLEVVMTGGMDNPVDVAFTPGGERIFTTTFLQNPAGGRRDGLLHAVYGGIYGKDHDPIHEPQHKWTDPNLMPVLSHLGAAAPCGLVTYQSAIFGPDFESNIFAASFNMHKITRHQLEPAGATFHSRDSDFLVSANLDFHPTDVLEHADGSLIVVDTGGWYKLCCPTSQLHKPDVLGAIYRVRRSGVARPTDPYGNQIEWSKLQAGGLVRYLSDDRPAVRERAIERLSQIGAASVAALKPLLQPGAANGRAASALHAVWALTRIDDNSARAAVRGAVKHPDDSVRQAALHSISLWRDAAAKDLLAEVLQSGTAQNRRAAAEALGRLNDRSVVPLLFDAIANAQESATEPARDRFLDHSITFALIELADPAATLARLRDPNPHVRRAALIALDQMDRSPLQANQVAGMLESPDAPVREAARWIAARHADWADPLADYLSRRLAAAGTLSDSARTELKNQLAQFARNPTIQGMLAAAVTGGPKQKPDESAQRLALDAMRESGLKELPASWVVAVIEASGARPAVRDVAISVARAIPAPKTDSDQLATVLGQLARDEQLPATTRLEAIAAAPAGMKIEPPVFQFLIDHLHPDQPVTSRAAAVAVLAKAKLDRQQLSSLADSLATTGPLEVDRLLAAFEQSSDADIGLQLVSSLKRSPALPALRADSIQRSIAKCGPAVQAEAQPLYTAIRVDLAKQQARLEELLGAVSQGGDIRRGQAVFMSAKAACSACHQFGYLGGNIGPDLTRIGGIRTERDLLESIAFPSASFVRSYEPIVVATRDGKIASGVVRKEGPDDLLLAINATETVRIARDEIDEIRPGSVSVMPSGLEQQLSPQELTDLIAFLRAAK